MSFDSGPIKEAIDGFSSQTTEVSITIDGLDDNNTKQFLEALFNKVETSPLGIKQLLALKFIGDMTSKQQEILAQVLENSLETKLKEIYNQAYTHETNIENNKRPTEKKRLPDKLHSDILRNFSSKIQYIDISEEIVGAENRKMLLGALKKCMDTKLNDPRNLGGAIEDDVIASVKLPKGKPEFDEIIGTSKDEIIRNRMKEYLASKGLGSDNPPKELFDEMLDYCKKFGIAKGGYGLPFEVLLDESSTYRKIRNFLWTNLKEQALNELQRKYASPESRKKTPQAFFQDVYAKFYDKSITTKVGEEVSLLPDTAASNIYHKEMMTACMDFLKIGGFQKHVGLAKILIPCPQGRIPEMAYDFADIIQPIIDHAKAGRPLPFSHLYIKHHFQSNNLFKNLEDLATAVADKPGAYHRLEKIEIDPVEAIKNPDPDGYEAYLHHMLELAKRTPNGLATSIYLGNLERFVEIKLKREIDENARNPAKKEELEAQMKRIQKLSDELNLRIAQNRREINSKILFEGEKALGTSASVQLDGGKVQEAESLKDVRSCKRFEDLKGAMSSIATEQEAEQEQEQEQEKEKEQEQEQEQEKQQGHGVAEDNIASMEEFVEYLTKLQPKLHQKSDQLAALWHNLMGNLKTDQPNSSLGAISKEVAKQILSDPDSFMFGLVENDLPIGLKIGNLTVKDPVSGEVTTKKGFYLDNSKQHEPTPLTLVVQNEPIRRIRLKVSAKDFTLDHKPGDIGLDTKLAVKKVFEELTSEEINNYNAGQLGDEGEIVAHKMVFMTCAEKGALKYRSWAEEDITKKLFATKRNQEIAEIAVAFGGDALFALTDKLNDIEKKCKKNGAKTLFDEFLDKAILQNGLQSISDRETLGNHLLKHDQFEALDKIEKMPPDELKLFLHFINEHAKYNARVDFHDLYLGFNEFVRQYKAVTNGAPLPSENIDKLVKDCRNMKVGMGRIIYILENAKKNGLINEQLAVLTQLELHYGVSYQAAKQHYRIVLPEMGVNKDNLMINPLLTRENIHLTQSELFKAFIGDRPLIATNIDPKRVTLNDCKEGLFCHYALAKTAPPLADMKRFAKQIEDLKDPPIKNAGTVKSYLYSISGFCLFHDKGLADVTNVEKFNELARSIDTFFEANAANAGIIEFLDETIRCQQKFFKEGKGDAPTLESLTSFINTMAKCADKFKDLNDSSPKKIQNAFHPFLQFKNNQDLFGPIHKYATKPNDKLSDKNLAHTLNVLDKLTTDAENNETKAKVCALSGGILHTLALIGDPGDNYNATGNSENLTAFIANLEKLATENEVGFRSVENLLNVMRYAKIDTLTEPYPTWTQLKTMVESATRNPQAGPQEMALWIKQQPGFTSVNFDLSLLKPKEVQSQSYDGAYLAAQEKLLAAAGVVGIALTKEECKTFDEFLQKLIDNKAEDKLGYDITLFPTLKDFLFEANKGALADVKKGLTEFTSSEKESLASAMISLYKPESTDPKSLADVSKLTKSFAQSHGELTELFKQINLCKTNEADIPSIIKDLAALKKGDIPIDELSRLLAIANQATEDSEVFPQTLLSKVLTYKETIADWKTFNTVLEQGIIPKSNINQEKLLGLALSLASKNRLALDTLTPLTALANTHVGVYEATVTLITNQNQLNLTPDVTKISASVAKLLAQGIKPEEVTKLINQLSKGTSNAIAKEVLNQLDKIDKEKLALITTILNLSLAQSKMTTDDKVVKAFENLNILSIEDLTRLSKLNIDAPYPNISQLVNNNKPIVLDTFVDQLQKSFFDANNDPNELSLISKDDRVIPVLNKSGSLGGPKPIDPNIKQKLLQDYAYIHAIGLEQPVHLGKPLKDLTKAQLLDFQQQAIAKMRNPKNEDERKLATLQYIATIREVYYRATLDSTPGKEPPKGKFPFSTQIISLLQALENPNMNINEIATGQGKSLIAALYGSVLCAQGRPAIVCTSNLTLAKEGLDENEAFYHYMGIPTSVIEAQSTSKDFQHQGINYTDVSNMALYLAKCDIQDPLTMEKPGLILDEVDFTVLDEVTDFRFAVNLASSTEINLDEWLYKQINAFVDSPEFANKTITRESDVVNAILAMDKAFDLALKDKSLKEPALSHIQKRLSAFKIPGSEARKQLDTWIDSAFNAKILFEQGRETAWTLEQYRHKDGKEYSAARIISHHRVSKGAKWSKGVHQFLHARINEKMTDVPPCRIEIEKSHVAALSSKNFVDYFIKRLGSVWGITGTIGSAEERAELIKKYGFTLNQIETHQDRKAKSEKPIFASDEKGHISAIYGKYKQHAIDKNRMPTVIVEEDAELARRLKDKFLEKLNSQAKKLAEPPLVQFYNGIEYAVYQYDKAQGIYLPQVTKSYDTVELLETEIKKQGGIENTITITTPMMGRGTDFKPVDKNGKAHPDGLFVIGAYAEASEREERQIVGRMGRQGQNGLYINIINKKRFIEKLEQVGIKVSSFTRYFSPYSLKKELTNFKKSKNKSLASERQFKQTYGDIRGQFYDKFIDTIGMADPKYKLDAFDPTCKLAKLMAMMKPPATDPVDFSAKFKKNLLTCWNQYLVELDRKYLELKDKHTDYEVIFNELGKFAAESWNDNVIQEMRNRFNIDADNKEANIFFMDYQTFTGKDLATYTELRKQQDTALNKPLADDNKYQSEFELINYDASLSHIIKAGRLTIAQDPSLNIQGKPITDVVINYGKHFWMREPDKLAGLAPDEAKAKMAHFLAVDMLNNLHKLNEALKHDKSLTLRHSLDLPAMMKAIGDDPVGMYQKLSNDYHKLAFIADSLTKDNDPNDKRYTALRSEAIYEDVEIFNLLAHEVKPKFKEPNPVSELLSIAENTRETMEIQARGELYMARRQNNPLQAVNYQIYYTGDKPLPLYGFTTLKQDIQSDIEQYLNDKSKLFARTSDAKDLLRKIDSAHTNEALLACLSEARRVILDKDLKSKAPGKTNIQGSRFQNLLNKGLARVLLNATTKEELLKVQSILRTELYQQMKYIQDHAKVDISKQIEKLQDPNLTHEGMNDLIKELKNLKETQQDSAKARIDFKLLDNALNVMTATIDKIAVAKIDTSEVLGPMEQVQQPKEHAPSKRDAVELVDSQVVRISEHDGIGVDDLMDIDVPEVVAPKDFATVSSELYQTKTLSQQLSKSQKKGEEAVEGYMLISSIASKRDAELIKKIADFIKIINSDVQLSDGARYEIMRGMLSNLHEQRKGNIKESSFLQNLAEQTLKSEKNSYSDKGKVPKTHEECKEEYQKYASNPLMISSYRRAPKMGG